MKINKNISEIRAEVLLNFLYPKLEDHWTAHCDGTFYRNYNGDAMLIDETTGELRLSRDGFIKLLPQGVLTNDDDLQGEDTAEKFEELERRQQLLHEAFLPFDTYIFHKKLTIERQTSSLLNTKLEYLLKEYFDFDLSQEPSPLVRDAAVLLPFISRYKGDLGFVAQILSALMNCPVETRKGRYSESDTTVSWLPSVRYDLMIPGLSAAGYRAQNEAFLPLARFLKEWFIPFEVHCEMVIKEDVPHQPIGDRLILNYNTELNI